MNDPIERGDAVEVIKKNHYNVGGCGATLKVMIEQINAIPSADRPQGEWIDCEEPPSTGRNVFIAYGTDNMKSVCIGHYEHDMKLWYEDKNFFAKPIFDALYWCEIPQFPTRMKGTDDEDN